MQNPTRSMASLLTAAGIMAVAGSTHAQAYRVRVLESAADQHSWPTSITDAGDVVGRVGDVHAVWQSAPGFGRTAGLTLLAEIDQRGATQAPTGTVHHADAAGYWYGSRDGRASVWSPEFGFEQLEHTNGRVSSVQDGAWPELVVGYENNKSRQAEPVAWVNGAAIRLQMPDWSNYTTADGTNKSGTIVGTATLLSDAKWDTLHEAGVIWLNGEVVELSSVVVGNPMHISRAMGINESGQIAVGIVDASGIWRAAVLEPAGGDMNGDGQTTSTDFTVWLSFAGASDRRADFNGDGTVDQLDLNDMLASIEGRVVQPNQQTDRNTRTEQLSAAFLLDGIYDAEIALASDDVALHPIQPGNSGWHEWKDNGNWNDYHPQYNPNCYGCSGDDPNNPHSPDGAPGWPGNDPGSPYKPNGGPGGPGEDGNPAGDGGDGGAGKDGDGNQEPGNGGPGGAGGDNTDDGPGGDAGDGGNGGDGGNEQPGGDGGTGGDGGNGGPNGGNSGDGGDGGNGGSGGPGIRPGAGAPGGPGGNGGDAGDSPNGDAGNGGDGGPGGTGGSGQSGPGGSGGAGGDAGSGGDAPNGDGGNGGSGGNGGTGGTGDGAGGDGGSGGGGGNGGDGGDGNSNGGNGGSGGGEGSGGSGGTGSPNGNDGGDGNGGSDGSP